MRRIASAALTVLMAFSLMLSLSSTASANALAGGGNSSSYSGESVFTNQPAGGSGQFSAIFFNDGSTTWAPGVVGLLICDASKTTCNVASPNAAYASGWFSSTVYATVSATVPPGSNGFFVYNFVVPSGTAAGTVATFNGDVGSIATGLEFRPQGYFQINTTPSATGGLTISPSSASLPVGGTQQFTVTNAPSGSTVNWSVTGGCGAITSAGLFAATATNSATQPCNVVATAGGLTGSAPITVFGPANSLSCAANPTSTVANGSNTVIVTATVKDANGNTVSNSSASVTFNNDTPTTDTLTTSSGTNTVAASSGVATATATTTTTSGNIQVSASSGTLTGCNVIVASSAPGTSVATTSAFSPNPIAADTVSTSVLTVNINDSAGNRNIADNSTVITVTRDSGSANNCTITGSTQGTGATFSAGSGSATAVSGRVRFTFTATSTPGNCLEQTTTSSSSISGSSATLTTQLVGAANKLAVSSNDSPHQASSGTCPSAASCTTVTILVQDVNGNRVTSSSAAITATTDSGSCSSSATGGPVTPSSQTVSASGGIATFTFSSAGAYSGCTITYTSTNLTSTTSTEVWTAGSADHLTCSFSPARIVDDGASTSTATVRVKDTLGNTVTSGSYSVTFSRTGGSATTLLTSNPQTTSGGSTTFTVQSKLGTTGTDTYRGDQTSGNTPTLPLTAGGSNSPQDSLGSTTFAAGSNGSCQVSSQTVVP